MKNNNKNKIYKYYYFLAGLEILIVALALWVAIDIHSTYDNSIKKNDEWAQRLASLQDVSALLVKALKPGNAVFENGQVEQERQTFKKISANLNSTFDKVLNDALNSPEIYSTLMPLLLDTKMKVDHATEDTYFVFEMYEQKNIDTAATYMSKMDAGLLGALDNLYSISSSLRKQQESDLKLGLNNASRLIESELLVGFIVTFSLLFMIYLGKKLRERMVLSEKNLNEKTQNLIHMEEGLNKHAIVARTDRKGTILSVNDTFVEVSGYSREELVGQNHRLLNSGYHPKEFFVDLWRTISAGHRWRGQIKNKKKDGSYYWVDGTITPRVDNKGRVVEYLSIRMDITAQKRHEEQLISLKDEAVLQKDKAQHAEAAKATFLANMSHEIRTPLNGVLGMVEILSETNLTPSQTDMLGVIGNCGSDLLTILNDILDYSKIESGKLEIEELAFRPKDCILETVQLFSGSASLKSCYIVTDVPDDLPELLLGDKGRIKQILSNYMSNAIKFSKNSYVEIGCKVVKEGPADTVKYYVRDHGLGIPIEVQGKLFDAFVQGDQSITKEYGGTGLGLSINSKLAELMGGTVSFESTEGKGSTFFVSLPFNIADKNKEIDENIHDYDKLKFEGNILVAEDNLINQRIITKYISECGLSCHIAENGQEVINELENNGLNRYDLILMDLQMPIMDGLTATKTIKEKFGDNHPKIVALTANAFKEDRENCYKEGMVGYLSKPIKKIDLRKIFLKHLNLSKKAG